MPFRPDPFLQRFERLRALRRTPGLGYAIAIVSVAVASGVRAGFSDLLSGIPFGPYYLAVAVSTTLGGGGAGLAALALSVGAANYLLPPAPFAQTFTAAGMAASALFIVVAGAMLGLIWLLNHAIDRIWIHAENTRLVVEAQPAGIIGVDADGRITLVNSAVERQLGYSREDLLDQLVDRVVPVPLRDGHAKLRASYVENPEPRMMGMGRDLSAVAKDGSLLPVEIGLNPVFSGGLMGALATIVDISERKNLERRAQILANEVSHRARNLLTVVLAIANRKLPREHSAEFVRTLETLARTQEIFGSRTIAPLRSIIEGELAAFTAQTSIAGCNVLLTPAAGQDFSLVIHELATNALKYGALSTATGAVEIEGHENDDGRFEFVWTERRGPPIATPPKRVGFGQKVLREIAKGLSGQMSVNFAPEGFRYELTIPIDRITNVSELADMPREA